MKRLCAESSCNNITDGKWCAKHLRTGWQKTDEKRARAGDRGYGQVWRLISEEVRRARPICECPGYSRCKHEPGRCGARSQEVDHISRRADELAAGRNPDRNENLRPLCRSCHVQKTLEEVNELRRRKPIRRNP